MLALFRNRAELKKAYGELQEEIYRLKDRIKQQEGATQRVQEMLGALETRLGLTETAYPALVFYQLRRLWQTGRELLERFVAELAAQQEERERRQQLVEHNRRQFAKRQAAEQRLRDARAARCGRGERGWPISTAQARPAAAVLALLQAPRSGADASRRRALPPPQRSVSLSAAREAVEEIAARAVTRIPRPVARCAPRDQHRGDRLCRGAVPAARPHAAGHAGARGHAPPRGDGRVRLTGGMRGADDADRARGRSAAGTRQPDPGSQAEIGAAATGGALSRGSRCGADGGVAGLRRGRRARRRCRAAWRPPACPTCSPRTPGTSTASCCADWRKSAPGDLRGQPGGGDSSRGPRAASGRLPACCRILSPGPPIHGCGTPVLAVFSRGSPEWSSRIMSAVMCDRLIQDHVRDLVAVLLLVDLVDAWRAAAGRARPGACCRSTAASCPPRRARRAAWRGSATPCAAPCMVSIALMSAASHW